MAENTKDWDRYEAGKQYNNRLEPNYYDTVNANYDFFTGNQWRNLPDSDMPKPVFNIIKRAATFFVASLTTSKAKLHYEPLMLADNTPDQEIDAADVANAQTDMLFDKFKMDIRTRDALFDGVNSGDYCAHFYWDMEKRPYNYAPGVQGEMCMELIDGTDVMFGNGNITATEPQPYIIISGRDTVKNLKEEAKRYAEMMQQPDQDEEKTSDEFNGITSDGEWQYQAGTNSEIEVEGDESGKALYIIVYRKRTGQVPVIDPVTGEPQIDPMTGEPKMETKTTVTASKSVRSAYIYQDIDTGLSRYPVAWANWEKQKGTYHGRALTTGLLPNQIFINRMFAMVMYHLMMTAFPKAVYNADAIDLWDNSIGAAIPVSGVDMQTNLKNIASYLEPSSMAAQITEVIEMVMQYTKETIGISDAALGQIDPKNTSAIIAVQKSSAIPLENPKANLYDWIEDIGHIIFDFMGTYYGLRPIVREIEVPLPPTIDPMTGMPTQSGETKKQKVTEMYDFSIFKDLWLDVKADVGESSYWSQIAANQTLDNLLSQGHLDIVQYLDRVPDEYIPQKAELIDEVKKRMADMAAQQAMIQATQPPGASPQPAA